MSELIPEQSFPPYAEELIEYFKHNAKVTEYRERGLIFTNNFSEYVVEEPYDELMPGLLHPYDYRDKPFAHHLDRLRQAHPDEWAHVAQVKSVLGPKLKEYAEKLFSTQYADEVLGAEIDDLYWEKAAASDALFRIIAPWLQEADVPLLEVCSM